MSDPVPLKRALSLPLLSLYGLGTILGAGIYVLIGEVAGRAGMLAPLAFVAAALIAALTGLSYAELSARLPRSAGEAAYLQAAFGRRWLSSAAGWGVAAIGVVSCATIVNGATGYLATFLALPHALVVATLAIALGALAAWGISQSAWTAAGVTLVEIGGLLAVVASAGGSLAEVPLRWRELLPGDDAAEWAGIALGAFLAFYAFIGFEDMVNVAEEVRDPARTLPAAIVIAMVVTTLLYLAVALVSVMTVPPERLSQSGAPLAAVVTTRGPVTAEVISTIGLVAVLNGALIQVIMASRVIYGLGRQALGPLWLGMVHPRTRTPLRSTILVTAVVLVLAVSVPLVRLAEITSFITLTIFTAVNLALLRLKLGGPPPEGAPRLPAWVPGAGALTCALLLTAQLILATPG